jgi:VIT1/CCC1 family predicted Fe2+/Mn2+ transporter
MDGQDNWAQEKQSAFLYRVIAEVEPSPIRKALFAALAEEADSQAAIWAEQVLASGKKVDRDYSPNARVRFVARLVRRLGVRPLRAVLAAMKVRGMAVYDGGGRVHPSRTEQGHPMPTSLSDVGRRHHARDGGVSLRAAVFGVNDGLVSNASLILGITGASANNRMIVVSGTAGLLAGAFSMAAGEYISVRSQREMFEKQIAAEREELAKYPEEEAAELALIYHARGLSKEDAKRIADQLISDPKDALDTLAREELGLNPDELGSPWRAATSSLISFAFGAFIPLIPFILVQGTVALEASISLAAASLFGVGATISLFTGRSALWGGLRMLLIGGAAGGATYLIGRALGVAIG